MRLVFSYANGYFASSTVVTWLPTGWLVTRSQNDSTDSGTSVHGTTIVVPDTGHLVDPETFRGPHEEEEGGEA